MEIKKLSGVEQVNNVVNNQQQLVENKDSEIDLNLSDQTSDDQEKPDLNLNFNLESIDTSFSFTQKKDMSEKAFGDEILNKDSYKNTPFTKTKRFEDTSLKANYTINPELNQNKVTFGLNYLGKNDFQASVDLQHNKTGDSDSIGAKGNVVKGFELLDGKGEVNATVIGNHTTGDDTSVLNNKVDVLYESPLYRIQNAKYSVGTKLSEETTISNGSVTDAKVGMEVGVRLDDSYFFDMFSTGFEASGGVYADLTPDSKSTLTGKGNFVIFKQFNMEDVIYAKISGGFSFAGNNEFTNVGQTYGLDIRTPLSFSTERALSFAANYTMERHFADGDSTLQQDLNFKAAYRTDKGNDIYAQYNYDFANNEHSASVGAKFKL